MFEIGKGKTIHISTNIKRKKFSRVFKDNAELFALTLPALICFFLFNYLPMFGVVLAFKDYQYDKGIFGSSLVGLKNFEFFFSSQDAWRVTRNTVAYNFVFIVAGIAVALLIALLLYELKSKIGIKTYQTIMILPRFLSWVIVAYISYLFFNPTLGIFNHVLTAFGQKPIEWYGETKYWPYIIVLTNIWKNMGMDSIIYYAALMGIDQELFEAAKIDGANRLQQTWHISIPSITPVMIILFILAVGGIFNGDFGLFYQITRDVGALYPVTDIIPTYVFRGLKGGEYGMSSAVGLFQSVMGLILVLVTNQIVKKINSENALF